MALRHISFDQVDEACLQRLIETGAAESRGIEYKSATYGGNDDARAEFLADVSSLANTAGGDLIIGIAETNGVPTALVPITGDFDAECLRLEGMARDGLDPRIPNLRVRPVVIEGGAAIVLRVPRSYNPPHRVVFKGKNRFWARSSAGKYELDVDELRTLFALAPQLADRIRGVRADRVAKIAAGEGPVALAGVARLVIHLIPYSAFDIGAGAALSLDFVEQHPGFFPTLFWGHPENWRVNFDGFLALSDPGVEAVMQRAYVQVFRSGIIEAVANLGDGTRAIDAFALERQIVGLSREYAVSLKECGVSPPFALLVSLLGTRTNRLVMGSGGIWPADQVPLDREQLHFPEVILEEIPESNQAYAPMVRPILDQLANAAGRPSAANFGADGNYQPKY